MEENICNFHQNRIQKLSKLQLKTVLKKKNPYLFKAKYYLTAADLVENIVSAFISSAEETIFGDWLEGLAIFICEKVYKGRKSSATGIDLEFEKDDIRYIVTIKSGPNWGNSSQIANMKANFNKAKRILRTSKSGIKNIQAINGCCYGIESHSDKGDYFKYCGQDFWDFISGEKTLYLDIIEPLGTKAREKNEEFQEAYAKMLNKFTFEFMHEFCLDDGSINWSKLVKFNSEKKIISSSPTT
ncbi:PmeII family type II restriction endonuclease [Parabacteroides pacaensis]|uniref:PmeII family type II restriction endonuclease n=1 Tax=Parabacteroides pacaensis TaxID=2086575 RepID=UPI00131AFF8A|nr:PmeII family type II restriction endonuclease [Parabacteroides pacaensis]